MPSEMYQFYKFRDGMCVKLLHYTNNKWAAEQAMLKTYNRTSSDIACTGMNELTYSPYVVFDGRNFH